MPDIKDIAVSAENIVNDEQLENNFSSENKYTNPMMKGFAGSSTGNALVPQDQQEETIVKQDDLNTVPQSENSTNSGITLKFDHSLEFPEIKLFLNNPSPEEDPEHGDDTQMQQSKIIGILAPLVKIGETVIPFSGVDAMYLSDNPYPKVRLEIMDRFDLVKNFDKPKKDNIVQIQIIPAFENAYKKINLTFYIDELTFEDNMIYIDASYDIPKFYDIVLKSYGEITTYEFFEQVAKNLQLGFASNLDSTEDKRWIYIPNKKIYDALSQECLYGGNEKQILDWWIDYWNCLNLVDVYERNVNIDKDLKMWVMPRKFVETETTENTEPILMEAFITNNDIFRDFQIYTDSYTDSLNTNYAPDMIIESYKINDMEEDNFILRDGDVEKNIYTDYEYIGENFGDHSYLKQYRCREMWLNKVNGSTIELSLPQPCLGLMKGHKVNFYWYVVNDFLKDTKEDTIESNIPLPDDKERDEISGLDSQKIDDDMIIDKQVSGQYYITNSELNYNYNGGKYTWEHVLTLSRPEDQKEYFDWNSINIIQDK